MNADAPIRRVFLHSQRRRQRGGVAAVVVASLLVLIGVVCCAFGLQLDHQVEAASKQFMAAPICTGSSVDSTDCRLNTPMMVTDKWVRLGSRGGGGGRHYFLALRTYSGDTYQAQMTGADPFWEAVTTGQVIGTQRWHDSVVSMSSGDMRTITKAYPGPIRGSVHYFFTGFAGAWLVALVSLFVLVCIRASRGQ